MTNTPIAERTPEAKRAYHQGYRAGWEYALTMLAAGETPERIREVCGAHSDLLDSSAKEGEDG